MRPAAGEAVKLDTVWKYKENGRTDEYRAQFRVSGLIMHDMSMTCRVGDGPAEVLEVLSSVGQAGALGAALGKWAYSDGRPLLGIEYTFQPAAFIAGREMTALDAQLESWSVVPLDAALFCGSGKLACPVCASNNVVANGWHGNATSSKGRGALTTTFMASKKRVCKDCSESDSKKTFMDSACLDQLPQAFVNQLPVVRGAGAWRCMALHACMHGAAMQPCPRLSRIPPSHAGEVGEVWCSSGHHGHRDGYGARGRVVWAQLQGAQRWAAHTEGCARDGLLRDAGQGEGQGQGCLPQVGAALHGAAWSCMALHGVD
jgi:hypothetical protein